VLIQPQRVLVELQTVGNTGPGQLLCGLSLGRMGASKGPSKVHSSIGITLTYRNCGLPVWLETRVYLLVIGECPDPPFGYLLRVRRVPSCRSWSEELHCPYWAGIPFGQTVQSIWMMDCCQDGAKDLSHSSQRENAGNFGSQGTAGAMGKGKQQSVSTAKRKGVKGSANHLLESWYWSWTSW